jgi:hypothetical protein
VAREFVGNSKKKPLQRRKGTTEIATFYNLYRASVKDPAFKSGVMHFGAVFLLAFTDRSLDTANSPSDAAFSPLPPSPLLSPQNIERIFFGVDSVVAKAGHAPSG